MSTIRVLITAGGTREAIDDVRVVSNLSTGRFGMAIAKAFADLGCATTLLGSTKVNDIYKRGELDSRLEFIPFDSFQDLKAKLENQSKRRFDYVLMAAAVSDYTPVRHTGKMSSSPETTTITMTKNPKLLSSLTELFGPNCAVIGFKLLSGVSREELVAVARHQLTKANLLMTVANDLSELNENAHPVMLVEKSQETRLTGHRNEVAPQIARILCERLGQGTEDIRQSLFIPDEDATELFQCTQDQGDYSPLFDALPRIQYLVRSSSLHAIDSIPVPDLSADTVLQVLGTEAQKSRYFGGPFALHSPNNVTLLGFILPPRSLGSVPPIVIPELGEALHQQPVIHNNQVVGLLLSGADASAKDLKALWFMEETAGAEELVDRIIEYCIERGWNLVPMHPSDPIDLFERQGYSQAKDGKPGGALIAPGNRDDLNLAGSVCLFNPIDRTILLGRRLTPPWKDHWCFPGGKVEGDESPLDAARREIIEETGLSAPNWAPISSRTVFVGSDSGRAYEVTNFQFISIDNKEAIKSDELEAFWHPIDKVIDLKPMGAGTTRILRHVLKLFR